MQALLEERRQPCAWFPARMLARLVHRTVRHHPRMPAEPPLGTHHGECEASRMHLALGVAHFLLGSCGNICKTCLTSISLSLALVVSGLVRPPSAGSVLVVRC